jgi:hypothetical protein
MSFSVEDVVVEDLVDEFFVITEEKEEILESLCSPEGFLHVSWSDSIRVPHVINGSVSS